MASRSLVLLCHDSGIPERQKQVFCAKFLGLVSRNLKDVEISLLCLRLLWERYDTGGISVGRSLRSSLLEESISLLAKNPHRLRKRIQTLLSVLLGMYHDHRYINTMGWYDYELGHFSESDLMHRVWLLPLPSCLRLTTSQICLNGQSSDSVYSFTEADPWVSFLFTYRSFSCSIRCIDRT